MAGTPRAPRPAAAKSRKRPTTALTQIGTTGLVRYSGRVYEEWMPELQGERGRRVLREMSDNDPVIGAILWVTEMLLRQLKWDVRPGGSSADELADAQFVEDCLNDMEQTWEETVAEILSFLVYGFSYHEIVYRQRTRSQGSLYDDGRIGWRGWPIRGQETLLRWEFDDTGHVLGMWQLGPPDWIEHYIPMEKALLFRTTAKKGNPEGRSILRNSYRPWYFKKNIETIEAIGVERDLAGMPIAFVPPELLSSTATDDEKATLALIKSIVTGVKRDEMEGIVWPMQYDELGHPLFDFKLLSTGGQRQMNTDAIIGRYDQRITMTVIADFILLGHERVGSHALGAQKSRLFTTGLEAWADAICAVINLFAIPPLLRLNGRSTLTTPMVVHDDVERSDIVGLAQYIMQLAQAGFQLDITPDGPLLRYLMDQANLPAPVDPLNDDSNGANIHPQDPGDPAKGKRAKVSVVTDTRTPSPSQNRGLGGRGVRKPAAGISNTRAPVLNGAH